MKSWYCFGILLLSIFPLYSSAQSWMNSATRINLDSIYEPFYHGVASGDPLPSQVIIWTRVTPDTTAPDSIAVSWKIATDTNVTQIVNSGIIYTSADKDFTVKVDVTGLQPDSWYYYSFNAYGENSLTGRTKTTPHGDTDSLRFAVVSCSSYEHGYFNAYERIAHRNDIDAVLHLGDYIYEYQTGIYSNFITDRDYEPSNELLSLADYRIRFSHYRLDPDLRYLHQQYPWINIWDDHETANDAWTDGAQNHTTLTEGSWADRKSAAIQAYFEWLPIRPDPNDGQRVYRKFNFGDLMDLHMLDTRLEGRDEQVITTSPSLGDSSRTILGSDQYNWLVNQIDSSNAQWQIVGQQVMFSKLEAFSQPLNTDQWDGYPIERQLLINDLLANNLNNMVILTGDIHTSWANDLPFDPSNTYDAASGTGSVGVEFVTTSITSPGIDITLNTSIVQTLNPHIKYIDLTQKGYIILDVNKTRVQSDWYYVPTVTQQQYEDAFGSAWYVNDSANHLVENGSPSPSPSHLQPQAPLLPNTQVTGNQEITIPRQSVLFGIYPNPASDKVLLKYYLYSPETVEISLMDKLGREILNQTSMRQGPGMYFMELNIEQLNAGHYILLLKTAEQVQKRKLLVVK